MRLGMQLCVRRGGDSDGEFSDLVLYVYEFQFFGEDGGDGCVRFEAGGLTVLPRWLGVVMLGSCS